MNLRKTYEKFKNDPKGIKIMEGSVKIFDELLEDLKESHPEKYKEIDEKLYVLANGYHFNDSMLEEILSGMINDDGTKAPKWTVNETTQVARSNGIVFNKFNEYDWNYVMNMIYSDYCEVLGDNVTSYVKMAHKFLNDKDAPEGKALKYALCMKKDYQ